MASKHLLEGLMKRLIRDPWHERFDQILEDHLLPACDESGVPPEDVISIVGEELFMSTVWACAFEDFLTREFEDGANIVDEYLKRRGWKEPASVRTYMTALRNSTMSLHEVSDIVPGESFRARDLARGGEPMLISERSATRSLKPWDRIAARVVQVGPKTQIGGGVLLFEPQAAEACIHSLRELRKHKPEQRRFSKAMRQLSGDTAAAAPALTEALRTAGPMFTRFWLLNLIGRARGPQIPDLRNTEGDELLLCEARYPFAAGTTCDQIETVLDARPEFRRASATFWNWVGLKKPAARASSRGSLSFETRLEDGALVLGSVELKANALVLAANSQRRCDLGCALLSAALGERVRQPSLKTETVEQMIASARGTVPEQLDISEQERCAIVRETLDRHYREVLDNPVPMLGGKSPRAAVKTSSGRSQVAEWLKIMENSTAKATDHNSALAVYDFGWVWTELGIKELRR
jgi:hypothetical protein